tara:strand:- start:456 stop:1145 length:690 start_codon:yes stop_codon:yes gene_type:complete
MDDINRFVYGTPSQLFVFKKKLGDGKALSELFDQVRKDAQHYTQKQPSDPHSLYKRHLLHFLNSRCRGVHIDLPKLKQEKLLRISGEYPNQTLTLDSTHKKRSYGKSRLSASDSPRDGHTLRPDGSAFTHWNNLIGDADTSTRRVSDDGGEVPSSPPPPRRTAAVAPRASKTSGETCRLCGLPFVDPVATIHGEVYERYAIEKWFAAGNFTDPFTKERLFTTALFNVCE